MNETSVSNLEVCWKIVFEEMNISFSVSPECILRESPLHPGGQLNAKRSLSDVVVITRDEGYDEAPVTKLTLEELRSAVWRVAYSIDTLGLEKGSAIAIDMPMDVNSVVIYLAIVIAGYVVVSIADSFAPTEISMRLMISKAKAIFTQDFISRGGKKLPLYSKVIDAQSPMVIVIPNRSSTLSIKLRDGDISWHEYLERVDKSKEVEYIGVELPAEAFTNILFTSGTTGEPKAIPWTATTPLRAAADGWSHLNIGKGDVVAWPTNLGWMMGPLLIYCTLLNGATMALYNGSPLGSGFAKFVQDAKVTMLGVVPSIVRTWKSIDCAAVYDWSSICHFASTGEASGVDESLWLMGRAHYKPVIEICGGTEIGGGFVAGSLLQPQALSAFSTAAMGCSLFILGEDEAPRPLDFPGVGMPACNGKVLRRHGDVFERTSRGYYRAHGRADDTMNLGGVKVSSVEIEKVCNAVDESILETAAVAVPPPGGGPDKLVIAVVFKDFEGSGQFESIEGFVQLSFAEEIESSIQGFTYCSPSFPSKNSDK
ncbi:hypothetical protein K7X08_034759 [Anisodus acutangulus]|uniref:AMP-dependent synthetase/ligase domain-containing protein n=1 Tax=Anisodus acutangulus TaxID=402998 RepID=A0A9Q1R1Y1_9SOLA|nr:hypothetical protein K7X08_034759 [Anisodus acutangulus]